MPSLSSGQPFGLAQSADEIALQTGLGRTFVGSIFLALVTSLPEMVVSLSALKMGAFDLAIGNIFGSNMTNMFIVFFVFLSPILRGPILYDVGSTHIVDGCSQYFDGNHCYCRVFSKTRKRHFLDWGGIPGSWQFYFCPAQVCCMLYVRLKGKPAIFKESFV